MRRVLALTAAVLFLSACGLTSHGSSAPSKDPAVAALLAAAAKLTASTLHIQYQTDTPQGTVRVDADVDATTHAVRLHTSWDTPDVELSVNGSTLYVKWPGLSTTAWTHGDPAKLMPDGRIRHLLAMFALARPLAGVSNATRDEKGRYIGTMKFDAALTATTDSVEHDILTSYAMRAGGPTTAVPFEAELDSQGRLAELNYVLGYAGSPTFTKVRVSIFNYDRTFTIDVPPAASVTEATDVTYAKI
jgi:hypothetical protein